MKNQQQLVLEAYSKIKDYKTLENIIKNYIQKKAYEALPELSNLYEKTCMAKTNLLRFALEAFDLKALEIILSEIDYKNNATGKLMSEYIEQLERIDEEDYQDFLQPEEFMTFKKNAAQLLYSFEIKNLRNKESKIDSKILLGILSKISILLDNQELQKFAQQNEIDLSQFKDSHLKFFHDENFDPLIKDNEAIEYKLNNIERILKQTFLNKTHKNFKSKVIEAYQNLCSWPITLKIIKCIDQKFTDGEKCNILLSDYRSCYIDVQKTLYINLLDPGPLPYTIAHEFVHLLMDTLFRNKANPFFDIQNDAHWNKDNSKQLEKLSLEKQCLQNKDYADGSLKIIQLAKSFVEEKKEKEEEIKLKDFSYYIQDLKMNSLIPLFYFIYSYKEDKKFSEHDKENYIVAIASLLTKEPIKDIDSSKLLGEFPESLKYLVETYYPLIAQKYNLSKEQEWHLQRMADLLSREEGIDFTQEPIARYIETYVLNKQGLIKDQKIMDSYKGLEDYWNNYIDPLMNLCLAGQEQQMTDA